MWIMTTYGVLMLAKRTDLAENDGDFGRELQVRARDRKALVYLKQNYMGRTLGKIRYTPDRDYQYRAYCTHADFAAAMDRMVTEVTYEKFKPEAVWEDVHKLYLRLWGVIFGWYDRPDRKRQTTVKRWWEDISP